MSWCYYCELAMGGATGLEVTKDHVIPLSRGGRNHSINIVLCCKECNKLKKDLTLKKFVRRAQHLAKSQRKKGSDKEKHFLKIAKNAASLIVNCLEVYQKSLFSNKYDYDSYND